MSQKWQQIVEDMERILKQVEQDDKDLAEAIHSAEHPELRQVLLVALAVLRDGRKRRGAASSTGLEDTYLLNHLLPILEKVLGDEGEE